MVAMATKPTSQLAMRFPKRQESKEYTGRPFILSEHAHSEVCSWDPDMATIGTVNSHHRH